MNFIFSVVQTKSVILKSEKGLLGLNTSTSSKTAEVILGLMLVSNGAEGLEADSSNTTRSRRWFLRGLAIIGAFAGAIASSIFSYEVLSNAPQTSQASTSDVSLPSPVTEGRISLEKAVLLRKSTRDYSSEPISISQLSQILWSAQGVTHDGLRTTPSAGALYPLEIFVVSKNEGVKDLRPGIYHYEIGKHILFAVKTGDYSQELQSASLDQEAIGNAAATIVITAVFERTTAKYGQRGKQYVFQESGHVAQNIYLQAAALSLGAVVIGAFDDSRVRQVIGAGSDVTPVYVQPIGVLSPYSA